MTDRLVLHPRAMFGLDAGRLFVAVDGRDDTLVTEDGESLLAVIAAFVAPASRAAVEGELAGRGLDAGDVIDTLAADGILIAPAEAAALGGATAVNIQLLSLIVDLAHRIAGDVAGFGTAWPPATSELHAELHGVLAGLTRIAGALGAQRDDFVQSQLDALALPPRGLKLHIGAGKRRLAGWVNIDVAPAELAIDLRWGLPFGDGAASHVFLSHFLEHMSRFDADRLVRDIHRVLGDGGVVRIVVPSFRSYARAYLDADRRFFALQRERWPWTAALHTDLERILGYAAGADADPRTFLRDHRYGYDFETLAHLLSAAGFTDVVESGYMASGDPALRVDDHSACADVALDGRAFSLFVEARKRAA